MSDSEQPQRDWDELEPEPQTALRVDLGHRLDSLPPTCSLEAKVERFRHWLNERSINDRG